jgi:hypothetical protein
MAEEKQLTEEYVRFLNSRLTLVLTEAINSRMDAYSSTIRLCASTPLELRNFGFTAGADTHFSSIFPCQL